MLSVSVFFFFRSTAFAETFSFLSIIDELRMRKETKLPNTASAPKNIKILFPVDWYNPMPIAKNTEKWTRLSQRISNFPPIFDSENFSRATSPSVQSIQAESKRSPAPIMLFSWVPWRKNFAEIKPIKRLKIVIMLGLRGVCKNSLVSWREKNRVMVLSIKLSLLSPLLCKRFLCWIRKSSGLFIWDSFFPGKKLMRDSWLSDDGVKETLFPMIIWLRVSVMIVRLIG